MDVVMYTLNSSTLNELHRNNFQIMILVSLHFEVVFQGMTSILI